MYYMLPHWRNKDIFAKCHSCQIVIYTDTELIRPNQFDPPPVVTKLSSTGINA